LHGILAQITFRFRMNAALNSLTDLHDRLGAPASVRLSYVPTARHQPTVNVEVTSSEETFEREQAQYRSKQPDAAEGTLTLPLDESSRLQAREILDLLRRIDYPC
jgi:hypothetical protein